MEVTDIINASLPMLTLLFTLVSGALVQKTMQGIKRVSAKINEWPGWAKQLTVGALSLGLVKVGQLLAVQLDPATTLDNVSATQVGTLLTAVWATLRHEIEKRTKAAAAK